MNDATVVLRPEVRDLAAMVVFDGERLTFAVGALQRARRRLGRIPRAHRVEAAHQLTVLGMKIERHYGHGGALVLAELIALITELVEARARVAA